METTPAASPATSAMAPSPIQLTAKALEVVKQTFASQKLEGHHLRIGLLPGGCAGFSYDLDVVKELRAGDVSFVQEGVSIALAEDSIPMLQGTTVDYVDDGVHAGFAFKNPNARSTCGCGSSFQA